MDRPETENDEARSPFADVPQRSEHSGTRGDLVDEIQRVREQLSAYGEPATPAATAPPSEAAAAADNPMSASISGWAAAEDPARRVELEAMRMARLRALAESENEADAAPEVPVAQATTAMDDAGADPVFGAVVLGTNGHATIAQPVPSAHEDAPLARALPEVAARERFEAFRGERLALERELAAIAPDASAIEAELSEAERERAAVEREQAELECRRLELERRTLDVQMRRNEIDRRALELRRRRLDLGERLRASREAEDAAAPSGEAAPGGIAGVRIGIGPAHEAS
ncbi:MAG: hypothetical protein ACREM2_12120, partial [Vulcanimicrobiaceae bacterium]